MARVRNVPSTELPSEIAGVYEKFASDYGPFRGQVAVLAHVPAAVKHLTAMLMELRDAKTLPRRALELAIVATSKLNECHYCVAHHKPMLTVEGLSEGAIDRLLDYRNVAELTETDRLVVEYTIAVTNDSQRIRDELFARLRQHFSEAQIVELTLRIALCGFFNRFNDALQVDDDAAEHAAAAE